MLSSRSLRENKSGLPLVQTHSRESYADFIQNSNFTLYSGCWSNVQIVISHQEPDGRTWNIGVEMIYSSCFNNNTICYYWNTHWQIEHGHPVLVAIGLYPAGVGC